MSKAEEKAILYCCTKCENNKRNCGMKLSHGRNCIECSNYIKGYLQAEKDLELTWEDIEKITDIWDDLHEDEAVYGKTGCDTPEFYKEVLKRFKERKNK